MNKKIISISLIIFSLIFVSILGTMMLTITYNAKAADSKLVGILSTGSITDFQDGQTMSGGVVISIINNLTLVESRECEALVITGESPDGKVYTSSSKYGSNINSRDKNYINNKGTFTLKVIRNDNGVTTQLKFEQLINKE